MRLASAFVLTASFLSGCGGDAEVYATAQADAVRLVAGLGTTNCGEFLEDLQKSEIAKDAYTTWIQGYLSGRNIERLAPGLPSVVDLDESEGPFLSVKQYCEENPRKPVVYGVESFWKELIPD